MISSISASVLNTAVADSAGAMDCHLSDRLLELAPIAVYVCARNGTILRYNGRAAELWGRSPALNDPAERFCGSYRLYRLDGDLLPHAECPMADVLRTGVAVRNEEVAIERRDGTRIIALVNIDPLRNTAGDVVGAINCFHDISERKHLEEELRRSRRDFADFFDHGVVALHWVDRDGIILNANQAELDLLGYGRDEYVGHHIGEFHAERDVIEDILLRSSRGITLDKYPARLRARDGSIRHVLISSNVYFRGDQFIHTRCFTIDVTERQRAEAELRDNERRTRELLDALPVAVYTTDSAGRITFFNEAAVDLWGHRPELSKSEWCGSWRLYWPDGRPMPHEQCPMAVALKEQRPVRGAEAFAERPDGTRVPFIPYPTPLFDAAGVLTGAINTLVDITDRKRTEEQQNLLLREMHHRVKNAFALASSLVALSKRSAHTTLELAAAVSARLLALARAHELTLGDVVRGEQGTKTTTLADLAHAILSPYIDEERRDRQRIALSGPDVPVHGRAVASLALVLHEFATNAAKYGALSVASGRIAVEWRVAGDWLLLTWEERGGPPVSARPESEGFGNLLVHQTIAGQLGGEIARDWNPAGLTLRVSLSAARLGAPAAC